MSTQVSNVTARMLALAERAVGPNLAPPFAAELGEITPLFAEVAYADGYAPDPEISMEVFAAELERMLTEDFAAEASGEDNVTPAKKRRIRGQPLRDAAKRAIVILYGNRVPNEVILPNKRLVAEVCEYMIRHLQINTIKRKADGSYSEASTVLRAAGRK